MLPLWATCTRMTSPQRPAFMALGRVGQPSTSRYGLGSAVGLGYEACCARATTLHVATTMAMSVSARRFGRNIPVSLRGMVISGIFGGSCHVVQRFPKFESYCGDCRMSKGALLRAVPTLYAVQCGHVEPVIGPARGRPGVTGSTLPSRREECAVRARGRVPDTPRAPHWHGGAIILTPRCGRVALRAAGSTSPAARAGPAEYWRTRDRMVRAPACGGRKDR